MFPPKEQSVHTRDLPDWAYEQAHKALGCEEDYCPYPEVVAEVARNLMKNTLPPSLYVLLGVPQHNQWSIDPPPPVVLAISSNPEKLKDYENSLQVTTGDPMTGGRPWSPQYQHKGYAYTSCVVIGPVDNIDGQ